MAARFPVRQGLLKTRARQILARRDEILLRVFNPLVICKRRDLAEKILKGKAGLQLAYLEVEILGEIAPHRRNDFLFLVFGKGWRH